MSIYQVRNTITRSGTNPITRDEAKNYMKVDNTTDDNLIDDIISNVVQKAEGYVNKQMNTSLSIVGQFLIKGMRPRQEYYELDLLYPDSTLSVSSVTKEIGGESADTINTDLYWLYANKLFINDYLDEYLVKVTYTATTSDTDKFKLPLLKMISDSYINRENQVEGSLAEINLDSYKLLDPFKDFGTIV
jgi:hypothetical protein